MTMNAKPQAIMSRYVIPLERARELIGVQNIVFSDGTVKRLYLVRKSDNKPIDVTALLQGIGRQVGAALADEENIEYESMGKIWNFAIASPVTQVASAIVSRDKEDLKQIEDKDFLEKRVTSPALARWVASGFCLGFIISRIMAENLYIKSEEVPTSKEEAGALRRIVMGQAFLTAQRTEGVPWVGAIANAVLNDFLLEEDIDILADEETKKEIIEIVEEARSQIVEAQSSPDKLLN